VSFTSVTGTWTEPRVACASGDAGASSTVWIGLGGYTGANELEQAGTDANCNALGKPTYYAWFEVVPYPAYPIKLRVSPGDTIAASVNILPRDIELQVKNRTRGWTFTRRISWPFVPDTTSAEWIVEAPARCIRYSCKQAPLANFGSVTMTKIAAIGNASPGTLADPAWTASPIQLVAGPSRSHSISEGTPDDTAQLTTGAPEPAGASIPAAGAAPGPASADGTAFTVFWLSPASNG
jgi:hypothetical protein